MKKAWIENGIVRDVCPEGLDPYFIYGSEIGANYTEDVPTDAAHGWIKNDQGEWVAPLEPEPFVPDPQIQINAESQAYLNSTDWYVIRMAETGKPVPDDVLAARQAAREAIK